MGGKLRETNDEARTFAIGNKSLASLFVHTPAGKIFVHCPGSYHVLKLTPDLYLCHTAKNSLYQHLLYGNVYLVGQPVILAVSNLCSQQFSCVITLFLTLVCLSHM
jgi:hypothetical protein